MLKAIEAEKQDLKTQPPIDRIRDSLLLLDRLKAETVEVAQIRTGAIRELLATGWTHAELAAELGLSRGRIGQLAAYGPGKLPKS